MSDQEIYQKILRNVIDQTNSQEIETTEHLLEKLVGELMNHDRLLHVYIQTKDQASGS